MLQRWYVLGATEHTPIGHMDTGTSSSVSERPMGCLSPWEQKKWGSWVESKEKGQGAVICLCNRVLDWLGLTENFVCFITPSRGSAETPGQLRKQIMWVHPPDGHILQSYQHQLSYHWQRPALILETRIQKHITYMCVSTYTYVYICTHTCNKPPSL